MAPTKHSRYREHASPGQIVRQKTKNRKKSLKDQLRSVQRLLKQENLPATIRVAQERVLSMLENELKGKAKEAKDKKTAKKYKMVKFFELRKIQRRYKVCLKNLESCSEDEKREELERELNDVKQQWNYVTYFPTEMKYVSLFPPTPCHNEEVLKKKDDIFKMINSKVDSGEFQQACDMTSPPAKGMLSKKRKSSGSSFKIRQERDTEEDDNLPKPPLNDDFFIDTSPTKTKEANTGSSSQAETLTRNSKSAILGTVDKSSHKVKRLKDNREEEAVKKAKKEKKIKAKKSLEN